MRFDVLTLFRDMVAHAAGFGVTGRALERGLWQLATWNPRDFAADNYRTVDDRPYEGPAGETFTVTLDPREASGPVAATWVSLRD